MAKADRTGKRRERDSFRTRVPDLGYYFIVTDTKETEKNYLKGLRDSLPREVQTRITIKVSKTKTRKLVTTCREQAAMEPQYAEPWIIFDRDEVDGFDQIIESAEQAGISAGWSNPCIEVWFDAYFGTMHSYQDSVTCCQGFAETFKKKTGQEYEKSIARIYSLLNRYGNEAKAIEVAEYRLTQHVKSGVSKPSQMCPCTKVHTLVREIQEKVKSAVGITQQ